MIYTTPEQPKPIDLSTREGWMQGLQGMYLPRSWVGWKGETEGHEWTWKKEQDKIALSFPPNAWEAFSEEGWGAALTALFGHNVVSVIRKRETTRDDAGPSYAVLAAGGGMHIAIPEKFLPPRVKVTTSSVRSAVFAHESGMLAGLEMKETMTIAKILNDWVWGGDSPMDPIKLSQELSVEWEAGRPLVTAKLMVGEWNGKGCSQTVSIELGGDKRDIKLAGEKPDPQLVSQLWQFAAAGIRDSFFSSAPAGMGAPISGQLSAESLAQIVERENQRYMIS